MEGGLIACFLIGGLVYADTEAGGQFGISQPLIAATIAGWINGNLALGLQIGILLQLPYLIELPAGGSKVSVASLGAYVGSALGVSVLKSFPDTPSIVLGLSLFFGITVSWVTVPLQEWQRKSNSIFVKYADRAAEDGNLKKISRLNYLGFGGAFIFGVAACGLFFVLGKVLLEPLVPFVPAPLDANLRILTPVFLGAGLGALGWQFVKNRSGVVFSIIGAAISFLALLMKSS